MNRLGLTIYLFLLFTGYAHAGVCPELDGRLPILPNSIGAQHPELINRIYQIEMMFERPQVFSQHYSEQNDGEKASISDLINYYKAGLNALESSIPSIVQALRENDSYLAASLFNRFYSLSAGAAKAFEKIEKQGTLADAESKAEGLQGMIRGFMGELNGLLGIPNVASYSRTLGAIPEMKTAIANRFQRLEETLKRKKDLITHLESKYPRIFSHAKDFPTSKEVLEFAERRIKQKETDYLVTLGERIFWIEFKYNTSAFTVNGFNMSQFEEDLEILDFLGLKSKFSLMYVFRGGIQENLAKVFRQHQVPFVDLTGVRGSSLDLLNGVSH